MKGFGLRAVTRGTVTRKYMGKLVKDQGYFSKFACLGPDSQSLVMRLLFLEQGEHLSPGKFHDLILLGSSLPGFG